jgi:prepilin-type N-terminal cleavage/methylation domain-containing protein
MKLHFTSLLAARKLRRGFTPQSTPNALAKGRKTGFTLLEILAVVGVMAVLFTGGFFVYNWVTEAARVTKEAEIMHNIQRQVRMYAAANNLAVGANLPMSSLVSNDPNNPDPLKPFTSEPKSVTGQPFGCINKVPAVGESYVTSPKYHEQVKAKTDNFKNW